MSFKIKMNISSKAMDKYKMNLLTYIFLIHGLGGTIHPLGPLHAYLNFKGYKNVHRISYPVRSVSLTVSVQHVNDEIHRILGEREDEIILIGQSLGGVVCHELHTYGWNIEKSITIGSPHHGSSLLTWANWFLPPKISRLLEKQVFKDLLIQKPVVPTHPHYTISTSIAPYIPFDGQVWVSETKISDYNHHHIHFNNHWTLFIDPRLLWKVNKLIEKN
jgi:pimeloyl-ACP methyl ester carboxylesterase